MSEMIAAFPVDSEEIDSQEGKLPLWLAAERSHMQVVKELLQEQGVEQLAYHNKVCTFLQSVVLLATVTVS